MGASRWQWGLMLLIVGAAFGSLCIGPALPKPMIGKSPFQQGQLFGQGLALLVIFIGGSGFLVRQRVRRHDREDDEDEYRRE